MPSPAQTTVCRVLTGAGRSAIAVIQVNGPDAWRAIRSCVKFARDGEIAIGHVRYGQWVGAKSNDAPPESVVISMNKDKASKDAAIEVHCHGGAAAIERIIGDLRDAGAELASDSLDRSESILQDEAISMLSQCATERMAAIAMDQVRGALAQWSLRWLERLESDATDLEAREQAIIELRADALQVSRWGEIGVRLGVPFRVVLVGSPNVGKSTLMNRIVGWDRSITYDEAGTTRDVLHASTVLGGLPIRLTDTAGIRMSNEAIEREGVRRSEQEIHAADVVVTVSDSWSLNDGIQPPPSIVSALGAIAPERWLRVLNKADRLLPDEQERANNDSQLIQTVATTGDGVERLQHSIVASIAKSLPPAKAAVPVSSRQQELIKQLAIVERIDSAFELIHELRGPSIVGG